MISYNSNFGVTTQDTARLRPALYFEIMTQREPQNAVTRLEELLNTGSLKAQQTALRLLGLSAVDHASDNSASAQKTLRELVADMPRAGRSRLRWLMRTLVTPMKHSRGWSGRTWSGTPD